MGYTETKQKDRNGGTNFLRKIRSQMPALLLLLTYRIKSGSQRKSTKAPIILLRRFFV